MNDILKAIEIESRLKYLTDPKAKQLWEFLSDYVQQTFDPNNCQSTLVIPAYRVLDALSMINQDKIEYSGN